MNDIVSLIAQIQEAHRRLDGLQGNLLSQIPPSMGVGCAEEDVVELETKLGITLPISYRFFLRSVNGCTHLGVNRGGLLPVEKVNWFRTAYSAWIDAYTDNASQDISEQDHRVYGSHQDSTRFRQAYLPYLLQIGEVSAGTVYLLNPEVTDACGEWEAWDFCNHYPGASREPSFPLLLRDIRDRLWREVRICSATFDEGHIIAQALSELHGLIGDNPDSNMLTVTQYVMAKIRDDDAFAAWARSVSAPLVVLDALKKIHK